MKELLEKLVEKREQIAQSTSYLQGLKAEKAEIELGILEAMKEQELKSARYENLTATIAKRSTLKVNDEKAVVKYLKDSNLTDYLSERPNELFEVFRKQAEKEEKVIPGTEMQETEYLSIRAKKEDKNE